METLNEILQSAGHAGNSGLTFIQGVGAFFLAYLGGILASLTPCVYPMIPITVGVVGGMGPNRRSWREIWVRAAAYVSGMAMVYSFLGVLAGLTGRVFGSFTNTSGWYLGLGIVFTLSALVMLDVIPFDPMQWWSQLRHKLGLRRKGVPAAEQRKELTLLGAFGLGASSGFIAAPCTTPVLTSILGFVAQTQSVGQGLVLMIGFSLGLGTILLVIAGFAGAIQILPRSGAWMLTVKKVSGAILLAFSGYLIYRSGQLGGF